MKNSTAETIRGNRHINMAIEGKKRETREKSKTFTRLRKLESFICAETPTYKIKRKNARVKDFWENKIEQ